MNENESREFGSSVLWFLAGAVPVAMLGAIVIVAMARPRRPSGHWESLPPANRDLPREEWANATREYRFVEDR